MRVRVNLEFLLFHRSRNFPDTLNFCDKYDLVIDRETKFYFDPVIHERQRRPGRYSVGARVVL